MNPQTRPPSNCTPATSDKVLTTTFGVGVRFTCTLSLPLHPDGGLGFMTAEWSPRSPSRLTTSELVDYRAGRHQLLLRAADALGRSVVVVE
jgi:hypothetical protein